MKLFLSLVIRQSINGIQFDLLPCHNAEGDLFDFDLIHKMLTTHDHYLLPGVIKTEYINYQELADFAYSELPIAPNLQMKTYFNLVDGVKRVQELKYD